MERMTRSKSNISAGLGLAPQHWAVCIQEIDRLLTRHAAPGQYPETLAPPTQGSEIIIISLLLTRNAWLCFKYSRAKEQRVAMCWPSAGAASLGGLHPGGRPPTRSLFKSPTSSKRIPEVPRSSKIPLVALLHCTSLSVKLQIHQGKTQWVRGTTLWEG